MQNNARIGGILSIVAGGFFVFYLIGMAFMIIATAVINDDVAIYDYGTGGSEEFVIIAVVFYAIVFGVLSLSGILAIIA